MQLSEAEADELAEVIARDTHRLDALYSKGLLDSPPDPDLDRLTRFAANVMRVPVALVTLIDRDRQFFKSECGLTGPLKEARETPLSHSYCKHVVASKEPLLIRDSRVHPLTRTNPGTYTSGAVAYAGMPLIDQNGYALGTLCVFDIQPREWTEQELSVLRAIAAQIVAEIELKAKAYKLDVDLSRAREAEAQRLQLTRLTVHDLRTPLTGLKFCLESLGELGPLSNEQQEYVKLCIRSSDMLNRIVDNLLDMEAVAVRGKEALSRVPCDLNDLAERALDQVRGVAAHKGISLRRDLSLNLAPILADHEKITRVMVNLLGNAIKFTRSEGCVTLRTAPGAPGQVVFEVTDTGIGIAPEDREKIFKEGVCLNGASTSYESVGLGLTFCRRMVDAHEGKISIQSQVGVGSTFRVSLPSATFDSNFGD